MAAGTCWGSSGLVMRYLAASGFEAVEISALRLLVGTLALFAVLQRQRACVSMAIRWQQLPWLVVMGTGCLFLYSFCYAQAVQTISLSLVAVLIYTSPAIVMLISALLFHEALTAGKFAALALTITGCCLASGLFTGARGYSPQGIGFALSAALLYALYAILAKFQTRRSDALTVTAWCLLFGAAGAMLTVNFPHCISIFRQHPSVFIWVIIAGIFNTALPYLLYTMAVHGGDAGKAAMMASVEPVVATLLGALVFHEALTAGSLLAPLIVLSGLYIMNRSSTVREPAALASAALSQREEKNAK